MNGGFTLIEALVALAVLTVTAGVVLETQLVTLSAEQAARAAADLRVEAERVHTEVRLATDPDQILAGVPAGSGVSLSTLSLASSEDAADCTRWEIVSTLRPSSRLTLITRDISPSAGP